MTGISGTFAAVPDDAMLREKVREVLSRPGYHTENADAKIDWATELWLTVWEWILKAVLWIFNLSEGLPWVLRVLISAVSVLLLIVIFSHIAYTLFSALRGVDRKTSPLLEISSVGIGATELESLAEQAAGRGELIEAVRFLFRACLARFQDRERRQFRRGTTNREHLRRYRGSQFFVPLETLVSTIEWKWYGEEVCDAADYQACRQAHAEVVSILREPVRADAA